MSDFARILHDLEYTGHRIFPIFTLTWTFTDGN